MPFDGNGTFNRAYNWVNDKNNGINITASRMDGDSDGFATGLSTCITRDGQSLPTADLPMDGFGHTDVADATARDQYASLAQVQDSLANWVVAGGTADALTAGYSPAVTALTDGQLFFVRAGAANTTATPTFSPNGLTARTIKKNGGAAMVAGDIPGAGYEMILRYHTASTYYEMLNPYYSGMEVANGQVLFPATQNASTNANTLDDYEEGTWTPAITFGTPGNLNVVYGKQVGLYTKIGNTVTISCHLVTTTFTHTTASGNCLISGLPFTSKTLTDARWYSTMNVQGVTKASYTQFGVYLDSNTSILICNACGSGQVWDNITTADCASGTQQTRFFTFTYQTA